jgi:DHA1 family tetracycline resistance protein-like MFS transporter
MIKRYGVHRLVVLGLTSSAVCYLLCGLAPEGWMMYAIVAFNLFGFGTNSALRAQVSTAADERSQGETLGAASSLISLTAVMAPVISSYVLGLVSHYPRGDWRIGAPFYLCSALAAVGCVLALQHNHQVARGGVPAANSLH